MTFLVLMILVVCQQILRVCVSYYVLRQILFLFHLCIQRGRQAMTRSEAAGKKKLANRVNWLNS